jgi:predicted alpha/beta hydrolase family esterase
MDLTALRSSRVLLLPGWLNSGPTHWQSRWEQRHGFARVEQDDWDWPRRGDWMARLDEVLLADDAPAVLVAHSLGCQLVAAWAAHSRHTDRVRAALLVAPPDTEREDTPPQLFNWRPMVRRRLPFPSIAVASSDDPFCSLERARRIAADWGSTLHEIGARGHVNGDAGLGDWLDGIELLERLAGAAKR